MLYERPNSIVNWANSVSADVVEPSAGQKEIGWVVDDRPPAGWLNWFQNAVCTFLSYLEENGSGWANNWSSVALMSSANSAFDVYDISAGPAYGVEEEYYLFVGDSNETISLPVNYIDATPNAIAFDLGITVIYSVEYGNGYWLLGTNNTQYYSSDLVTFVENDNNCGTVYKILYADGHWVMVGTENHLYRASDPTGAFTDPWSTGNRVMYDIDYSPEEDLWVAVGEYYSSTANVWHIHGYPDDVMEGVAAGTNTLRCITHGVVDGETVWVAGGSGGDLFRSTNPTVSWTKIDNPFGVEVTFRTAKFGNGVFMVGTWDGDSLGGIAISRDGANWKKVRLATYFASEYYGDRFILSGEANSSHTISLRHGCWINSL